MKEELAALVGAAVEQVARERGLDWRSVSATSLSRNDSARDDSVPAHAKVRADLGEHPRYGLQSRIRLAIGEQQK